MSSPEEQAALLLMQRCDLQICCRRGFPDVIRILDRVVANMAGVPPGTELDMNNVTLRISLDVTGMVGFAKDFHTCSSFKDAGTDELFAIIQKSELLAGKYGNRYSREDIHSCIATLDADSSSLGG